VLDRVAADYWRALYVATLALLVWFRLGVPAVASLRYRMHVADIVEEGPGIVSLHIAGRGLRRLNAQAGQFFLWRFLAPDSWWKSHPFSLSAAPRDDALRITVKALGDFTSTIGRIRPGTRVVAEGPFGVFTKSARKQDKVVLIAGGIGITPVRALLEELGPDVDVAVVYRVVTRDDVVFEDELSQLVGASDFVLHVVAGDHRTEEGARLLSPAHLQELVPDVAERDVYICGPPAMADAIEKSVRASRVPKRHIHTERFAL
jgi:predicted ferric reductase